MPEIDEFLTLEEFYTKARKRSNSVDSEKNRRLHMAAFKRFCTNIHKETIEQAGESLRKQNSIGKTCKFLNQFIEYLQNESETITIEGKRKHTLKLKPKKPKSIPGYVAAVRSYLRLCHGIRINDDDFKDFVTMPKDESDDIQEEEPFKKDELKLVIESCQDQRRKSLYLFMSQTGARIAEALQIRKKHFDFTKEPVEVRLPKSIVKGKKKGRTNFIDKMASQRIKLLVKSLKDEDLVFTDNSELPAARNNEEQYFRRLCNELGFTERYEHNDRCKKNIHSIRAFCMTQYALANNSEDAGHAYVGHSKYLDQYMRLENEQKIERFRRAEPRLNLFSDIIIVERDQQEEIKDLRVRVKELENHIKSDQLTPEQETLVDEIARKQEELKDLLSKYPDWVRYSLQGKDKKNVAT